VISEDEFVAVERAYKRSLYAGRTLLVLIGFITGLLIGLTIHRYLHP
jgi:hypothetical protein